MKNLRSIVRHQGFSLIEVLISLLLFASLSLALIHQQWQTLQTFNQLRLRREALALLDNASEHWLATGAVLAMPQPFLLKVSDQPQGVNLRVWCQPPGLLNTDACDVQRHLSRL